MLTGLFLFGVLWFVLIRFLANGLSFEGWAAQLFAASFAAALTLLGFSLVLPFLEFPGVLRKRSVLHWGNLLPLGLALALGLFTVALPAVIQGGDWNGIIQHTVALGGWLVLGICAYRIRRPAARYSVATILGVLLLAAIRACRPAKSFGVNPSVKPTTTSSAPRKTTRFAMPPSILSMMRWEMSGTSLAAIYAGF
jgi:hypothetical protein